ncbi:MAG: peptidoglycan-binding protein [Alphaproteobacteria bacterium]|nr:peptidoglycan-binding protein [Alphaproteobacteria bacterium]
MPHGTSPTMPIRLAAGLLAALLLMGPSAGAADRSGQFAARGVGQATCADFVAAIDEQSTDYYITGGWLDGYLTAFSQLTADTYDIAPWQGTDALAAVITVNCERDPTQSLMGVIVAMAGALKGQRLRDRSTEVVAKVGEKSISLYQDTLRRMQEALAAAGHYKGTADGQFGPKTQAAIEAFQMARGIAVTGLPDQPTVWALLGPTLDPR